MVSENRRDQLINVTECFFENWIEHCLRDEDMLSKINKKYNLNLDDEDKEFMKELFVAHLIVDIF